ncbi:hypothetical protein [Novosphingobium gossypii]|uniref:hypothetical protein n=1 Tax=Novosphingobium gossypii TaxID=1604774 RepID=UPI003D1F0CB3
MKPRVLYCALALLSPSIAEARPSQWWYVAQGADKVLFVDVGSITRDGETVRFHANQVLRETGNPAASLSAYMIADCEKRTETWDLVQRYGADDERLDDAALSYAGSEPVAAGSVGEAQLQFVCATDRASAGGFPLAIDQVAFAEALIADTQASESPAALHERMRADPAVPVIRSTAPSPETFGTLQTAVVGHALVPPRDYSKGTQVPDAASYDTDESGTIYDISYRGIEEGQLALELRGYSIDDLVHASSGQTMRFPVDQKTIQILDVQIDVVTATPQDLRFRASRVPREDAEAPFVCRDPACTAQ